MAQIGISKNNIQQSSLIGIMRCPVASIPPTAHLHSLSFFKDVMVNAREGPITVFTDPLLPDNINLLLHCTSSMDGPHSGQRDVSVMIRHTSLALAAIIMPTENR